MSLNIPQAIDRLCYRYPSALVDAVTEHEPGKRLVAVKNVTVNEDFFQGHFPGTPLMPGVLMIETLAQVATLLLVQAPDGRVSGTPTSAASTMRSSGGRWCRATGCARGDARRPAQHAGARARGRVDRRCGGGRGRAGDGPRAGSRRAGRAAPVWPSIHGDRASGREIGAGTVVGPHAIIGEHVASAAIAASARRA